MARCAGVGRAVAQAASEAAATLQPISARRRVMPGMTRRRGTAATRVDAERAATRDYLGPMKQALATRACNSR